jgi:glycosyltransferase involved in cell wall biosynthesis
MKELVRNIKRALFQKHQDWSYLYMFLFFQKTIKSTDQRKISVAIPHYNNAKMIHTSWFNLLNDDRVSEVIILDDGSNEQELDQVIRKVKPFKKKIKLFKRSENWGALATKLQVIGLCKEEWVVLLDGDNTYFKETLDSIFTIEDWKKDTVYCTEFAYPHFDFKNMFQKNALDLNLVKTLDYSNKRYFTFFNDGNYFLPKKDFLQILDPTMNFIVKASEVSFMNAIWLHAGNTIQIIQNSKYLHRIHAKSTFINNMEHSKDENEILINMFLRKEILDIECLKQTYLQNPKQISSPQKVC